MSDVNDPATRAEIVANHAAAKASARMFVNQMGAARLPPAAQIEAASIALKAVLLAFVRPDKVMSMFAKMAGEMRRDIRDAISGAGR